MPIPASPNSFCVLVRIPYLSLGLFFGVDVQPSLSVSWKIKTIRQIGFYWYYFLLHTVCGTRFFFSIWKTLFYVDSSHIERLIYFADAGFTWLFLRGLILDTSTFDSKSIWNYNLFFGFWKQIRSQVHAVETRQYFSEI